MRPPRERGVPARLHVVAGSAELHRRRSVRHRRVTIQRADGARDEYAATPIDVDGLAVEWEWEQSPEVTLVVVDSIDEAVELCNRYSPHFVASLISDDPAEHDRFYAAVDAPFVGNGFTRWVDGQYALNAPELGLSNWQAGRTLRPRCDPVRRQRPHGAVPSGRDRSLRSTLMAATSRCR